MSRKVTFGEDIIVTPDFEVRRQARRRALRTDCTPKSILKPPSRFPDLPESWNLPTTCLLPSRRKKTKTSALHRTSNVEIVHHFRLSLQSSSPDEPEPLNCFNLPESLELLDLGKLPKTERKRQPTQVVTKREKCSSISTARRTKLPSTIKQDGGKEFVDKIKPKSTPSFADVTLDMKHAKKIGSNTSVATRDTGLRKTGSHELIVAAVKPTAGARLPPIQSKTTKNIHKEKTEKGNTAKTDAPGRKERMDKECHMTTNAVRKDSSKLDLIASKRSSATGKRSTFGHAEFESKKLPDIQAKASMRKTSCTSAQVRSRTAANLVQTKTKERPVSGECTPLRGQTTSTLLHAMYNNNSLFM